MNVEISWAKCYITQQVNHRCKPTTVIQRHVTSGALKMTDMKMQVMFQVS